MSRSLLAVVLVTCAAPVQAQSSDWSYTASVFGWFSGVDSSVDTRFGTVETELDFGDVWERLDVAFFGNFEARNGRWALVTDLVYTDLGSEVGTPFGAAFRRAEVDTRLTLFSAYAAYAMIDTPEFRFEVGPGFRYNDVSVDVDLVGNRLASRNLSFDDTWVDPLIGARMTFVLSGSWFANASFDVGGFGVDGASDSTWQAYAGLGYRFNERWAVQAGYRTLSIDRDFDGRDIEIELGGPMIGVQVSF